MKNNSSQLIQTHSPIDWDRLDALFAAVDEKTLQVTLNVPVSYFLSLMYFPTYYPVNEEFFTSCGDTFATSPETKT